MTVVSFLSDCNCLFLSACLIVSFSVSIWLMLAAELLSAYLPEAHWDTDRGGCSQEEGRRMNALRILWPEAPFMQKTTCEQGAGGGGKQYIDPDDTDSDGDGSDNDDNAEGRRGLPDDHVPDPDNQLVFLLPKTLALMEPDLQAQLCVYHAYPWNVPPATAQQQLLLPEPLSRRGSSSSSPQFVLLKRQNGIQGQNRHQRASKRKIQFSIGDSDSDISIESKERDIRDREREGNVDETENEARGARGAGGDVWAKPHLVFEHTNDHIYTAASSTPHPRHLHLVSQTSQAPANTVTVKSPLPPPPHIKSYALMQMQCSPGDTHCHATVHAQPSAASPSSTKAGDSGVGAVPSSGRGTDNSACTCYDLAWFLLTSACLSKGMRLSLVSLLCGGDIMFSIYNVCNM